MPASTTVPITNRSINSLQPKVKPYFLRDSNLKGFGIKVNPSGSIKFIAEVWHQGTTRRKTIGEFPILKVSEARTEALTTKFALA